MKKRNNKIKRLVMSVGICAMFITIALSTAIGIQINEQNNNDTTQEIAPVAEPSVNEQSNNNVTPGVATLSGGPPFGWNYWSNPPHMFNTNTGDIGIGTSTPAAKLDIYGNLAINGVVVIDASGHWVAPAIPCLWGLNGNDIYYNKGNVGIGTQTSPVAKLQVDNGAVLFSGIQGDTPVSGAGTRLMWIPNKGAFRAGTVNWNQWDWYNIGQYSTAMGISTTANGSYSTAMGQWTVASGQASTALGAETKAIGDYSTAMGTRMEVNGENSLGIGLDFHYPAYVVNDPHVMSIMGGNVGIGSTSPSAKLQVGDGAILFNGSIGDTPTSGAGTRLMWIPSKGAFRAGYVWSDQWDDNNIGFYSVAMGTGTKAKANGDIAMGGLTTASGGYSTALGSSTTASGVFSTAMGHETTASAQSSTAMGEGTTASEAYSTAMGHETTASGWISTAMGDATTADGDASTAMGQCITVNGVGSLGIGLNLHYPNWFVNSSHVMSIMGGNVGIGIVNPSSKLEINNSGELISIAGESNNPSIELRDLDNDGGLPHIDFTVGDADYDMRIIRPNSDVLSILGGNVGIGTTSPQEKLHVAGNYLRVDGTGGEAAYIGGDGWGADVQIGSFRSDINAVSFWNMATGTFMGGAMSELCIKGGSDIAEPFDVKEKDEIKPGMVLSIDTENPGQLTVSEKAYDRCVAGIISGAGDIKPGVILGQEGSLAYGKYPVALAGRVYGLCDASYGAIQPGDLLTTSPTPGYAMKVTDYATAQGAILGKAMTGLEVETGLVLILVSLQ